MFNRYTFGAGKLRGVFVGGGVRWQSQNRVQRIVTGLSPQNRPIYGATLSGPEILELDALLGYSGRLDFFGQRTTWRAQLNGYNDLLPTACAAAGVTIPVTTIVDGVDLLPFLRTAPTTTVQSSLAAATHAPANDRAPHDTLYWKIKSAAALRRGDWKLLLLAPDWKPQLYNLATDPGESRDLAAEQPTLTRELHAAWQIWNVPLPPPARTTPPTKAPAPPR